MLRYSYVKEVTWRKTNIMCLLKQQKATFMPRVATSMLIWSLQILYAPHWKQYFNCF